MLLQNAECRARLCAGTHGIETIGIPSPVHSHKMPRARVSVIPSAHLLRVLNVVGATMIALAFGSVSGSSGCLYSTRIGCSVRFSSKDISTNFVACGVAMTYTSHNASWASFTRSWIYIGSADRAAQVIT